MNTTDKDREEARNKLAKTIVASVAGSLEANPLYIGKVETLLCGFESRIRAETAEKAARKERERCADIAIDWVRCNHLPDGTLLGYPTSLRAVILAPESASEPRTCETCATGCLPNERVYVNPDAEDPCPGWTHRSPQSADVETVREAEKSYCIERVGANLYWGGSPMTGKYKGLDALVSISAAIRFARKEDAEMVRASQGMSPDEYVVTEHQWL